MREDLRKGPTSFLTLMILSASTLVDYLIKKFSYHSCIVVYKFTAKVGTKKGEDKECPPRENVFGMFYLNFRTVSQYESEKVSETKKNHPISRTVLIAFRTVLFTST